MHCCGLCHRSQEKLNNQFAVVYDGADDEREPEIWQLREGTIEALCRRPPARCGKLGIIASGCTHLHHCGQRDPPTRGRACQASTDAKASRGHLHGVRGVSGGCLSQVPLTPLRWCTEALYVSFDDVWDTTFVRL